MYVSAPTMFEGVTFSPVQTKSFTNCAVSGWLDFMQLITESRVFSCVASAGGLDVGVGLDEPVGVGVATCVCVGEGKTVGSGEGVGVWEAFWESSCAMAQ